MPNKTYLSNRITRLLFACLLFGVIPQAVAQGRGEENRPNRWEIPDDATSDNSQMLKGILARFPEADTNNDGKINAQEARALIAKQQQERQTQRDRNNWRRNRFAPTFDNIKYGPDDKHHFDLYLAQGDGPTPLVLFFHGGQFITGEENSFSPFNIRSLLNAGISVASIDYRETNAQPFPGPFDDAEMAVRFIRFYAEQLGIDRTRIAGLGNEAGGNLALYLALQDDLFDQETRDQLKAGKLEDPRETLPEGLVELPDTNQARRQRAGTARNDRGQRSSNQDQDEDGNETSPPDDITLEDLIPWDADAIKGASTKLNGAVALHPIATFDPRAWPQNNLPMNNHERLMGKYLDVRYLMPMNDPEIIKIVDRVSPLSLISADDPPLLLLSLYEDLPLADNTTWTIMRHHPKQSQVIADALNAKGGRAIVRYKGMQDDPGIRSTNFLIELLK